MSHLQRLILVTVLFAFSACSQNSVIESETSAPAPAETTTPYTAGTQTVQAASSLLPTFSFSMLPTFALPTGALTAIPSPRPQASALPVLYSNGSSLFLVGVFSEDQGWRSWRSWMGSSVDADTNYDFFSPNGFVQIQGIPLKPDFACALSEPMVGVVHGSITERREGTFCG